MTAATRHARARLDARQVAERIHSAWCTCGLRMVGSGLQIAAQAEAHWRQHDCPWRLELADPGRRAVEPSRSQASRREDTLALHAAGVPPVDAAQRLGVTLAGLAGRCRRLGVRWPGLATELTRQRREAAA